MNENEYKNKISCPEFVNRKISMNRGNLLVHQKFFWPCWRYAVTITCNMQERLNPFEKVVLELSNSVTCDSERISSMTGIDIDMVKFIQQLLQARNYLDNSFCITEDGRSVLKEDDENIKDYFFIVYQEAYTGELLPVIEESNTENLNSDEIWNHKFIPVQFNENDDLKDEKNFRHFYVSSSKATVGEETLDTQLVYSVSYPPFSAQENRNIVTPEKIINLIKTLRRRGQISMSKVSGIRVGSSPDAVLVLTDYGIENNNTRRDNLTTGFSRDWSPLMVRALSMLPAYDQNYISKIRKDAETNSADLTTKEDSAEIAALKERWWFNTYIRDRFIDACSILEDYNLNSIKNKNDNKYLDYCSKKLIIALYELLQVAFYQAAKDSLYYAVTISNLDYLERNSIAGKCLENLRIAGFDFDEKEDVIKKKMKIDPQKIRESMENEDSIVLWNVLAFCALECSGSDTREIHVLKELASQKPKALDTLFFINDTRNMYQHKTKDAVPLSESIAKKAYEEVYRIIDILLPARQIDKESGALVNLDENRRKRTSSAYVEKLFKAQNNIEHFFGRQVSFFIPDDVYNELENTEMQFIDKDEMDSQLYFSLAIIMQSLFFNLFLKEPYEYKNLTTSDCQNIRNQVLEEAVRIGFTSNNGIYAMLRRTNPRYISDSYVKRNDNTLGADCILWLYLADKETKAEVAKVVPDLLKVTDRLVELRGHNGSNPVECSYEELCSLRQEVYSFTKYLAENSKLSV